MVYLSWSKMSPQNLVFFHRVDYYIVVHLLFRGGYKYGRK